MADNPWDDALANKQKTLQEEIRITELFAPNDPRLALLKKELDDLKSMGADGKPPLDEKHQDLQPNEWVCPACRTKNDYFINDFCKFCGQPGPMAIMGS